MDYLIVTVIMAGLFQIVLSLLGVAKLMRFVPRSVMVGFVNALAILIFTAQVPNLIGVPWLVYPMVAVGVAIIVLLPKITTGGPGPAGLDHRGHRGRGDHRAERAHGRRPGRPAEEPAVAVHSARAVDPGHAEDRRPVRAWGWPWSG